MVKYEIKNVQESFCEGTEIIITSTYAFGFPDEVCLCENEAVVLASEHVDDVEASLCGCRIIAGKVGDRGTAKVRKGEGKEARLWVDGRFKTVAAGGSGAGGSGAGCWYWCWWCWCWCSGTSPTPVEFLQILRLSSTGSDQWMDG
ncbi:hypothetical protein M0802_007472 [Mischocyttarus mexicanus]|nr:hypothetical protein M0802_007472 [Mischocyttarus mexicanus]